MRGESIREGAAIVKALCQWQQARAQCLLGQSPAKWPPVRPPGAAILNNNSIVIR